MLDMNQMKLPAEAGPTAGMGGGDVPVCMKDYAGDGNVIERVDPVFTERRFNAVPVRIIIDKEGKVKHIHFLSAFPDQAKAITDAWGNGNSDGTCETDSRWRWKPASCLGARHIRRRPRQRTWRPNDRQKIQDAFDL